MLLGVGLGGLLDGIVLGEIVRWHPMPAGGFRLLLWLVALGGIVLLFSAIRAPGRTPSARAFAGNVLVGWGGFNLAEGAVNHFVLGVHHVGDLAQYDWLFLLAGGVGVLLLGLALRDAPDPGPVRERRSGYDRRSGLPV